MKTLLLIVSILAFAGALSALLGMADACDTSHWYKGG